MKIYFLLLIMLFAFCAELFAVSDPRTEALSAVEKELLYLTDLLKKKPDASTEKSSETSLIKVKLKLFVLLEQYILKNGLSEYSLNLINTYNEKKLNKSVLDCLTWKAIDFDLRYSSGDATWAHVLSQTGGTSEDVTSLSIILSDKIFRCLSRVTPSWKWTGPPYIYVSYENKARQIAINGLSLINAIENKNHSKGLTDQNK